MYDLMRGAHPIGGVLYMLLTIMILAFFVMNMFLAILLKNFEDNEELSASDGPSPFVRMKTMLSVTAAFKKGKKDAPGARNTPKRWSRTTEAAPRKDVSLFVFAPEARSEGLRDARREPDLRQGHHYVHPGRGADDGLPDAAHGPEHGHRDVFKVLDYIFAFIFLVECVAKVVAFGFLLTVPELLRDNWNILDFVIAVVSILMLIGDVAATRCPST